MQVSSIILQSFIFEFANREIFARKHIFVSEPDQIDPSSITFKDITAYTATVAWANVACSVDIYVLSIYPNYTGATVEPRRVPPGALTASLSGLKPASFYTLIIRTAAGKKLSAASTKSFQTQCKIILQSDFVQNYAIPPPVPI